LNWELFNKLDGRDLGVNEDKSGLHVAICLALADIFVENNGDLAGFEGKIQKIILENPHSPICVCISIHLSQIWVDVFLFDLYQSLS